MTERKFDLKVGDRIIQSDSPASRVVEISEISIFDNKELVGLKAVGLDTDKIYREFKTTVEHKLNLGVYRLERKGK